MSDVTRREFLDCSVQAGVGSAAVATLLTDRQLAAKTTSANERIVLGVIGLGARGNALARDFGERSDVEIAYLADVDLPKLESRSKSLEQKLPRSPQKVQDFRRILDDKAVDAVVIATPDHWHALATVWACQAGKHVFVEKPVSHSPWEGRKMVEAARKYNRVVQAGTQNRSAPYNMKAKQYIEDGKLGTIHYVRVFNQKGWGNEPAVSDSQTPSGLDWDMWNGPVELPSYNQNYHRHWNHFWRYSGGDTVNDSVHQIDLARWLIGRDYPNSVYSIGGRWAEEGVFDTPDTQISVFEFDELLMTLELTLFSPYMLKSDPGVRDNDMFPYWLQNSTRIEIYGTKGLMIVGRMGGGWQVFDRTRQRKPVVMAQQYGRFPDPAHQQDFLDSIRENRLPNADIEQGHRSTMLCQIANISSRLGGRKLMVDPKTESFVGDNEANALLKRDYREPWSVPTQV